MHAPLNEDQKIAVSSINEHQFEDITSAAAKMAKDYQSWVLEQMKISIGVALDYANGLASMNSRTGLNPNQDKREQAKSTPSPSADKNPIAVIKIADEYRAKAFELMAANINATLEYAQQLVNVKTPTEFVELSTGHARRQLDLIVKQATDLGSIAQRMATSNPDGVIVGFVKTSSERKE